MSQLRAFSSGLLAAILAAQGNELRAQIRPTIIDVHIHAMPTPLGYPTCPLAGVLGTKEPDGSDVCAAPFASPTSAAELRRLTFEALDRHNIRAVVSGQDLDVMETWRAERPDRIIPAVQTTGLNVDFASLRRMLQSGALGVIGEVTSQYAGLAPDDPKLEPLFALAEEEDRPIGIHVSGVGAPTAGFKAAFGDPLLLEPVLIKHPKLRLYVMHAGFPFLDRMVSLLRRHQNVYVDISWISWQMPRAVFYEYLRSLLDYGFGKRIMFGTDQVSWPQAIDVAVEGIQNAGFLTDAQKADIFYNNAARFLRISGPK